jgi:type I restriction enzyme S subunit
MVFTPERIHPFFIAYGLLSNYILFNQLYLLRLRAAQPHLNAEELGDTLVLCPPIDEQKNIVKYIETETSRIDQEISILEREIELLAEYRQALISEAVTGKIDVREVEVDG